MRWFLIALVLVSLHSLQEWFGIVVGQFAWYITLALLIYFGRSITRLQQVQAEQQEELRRLKKTVRSLTANQAHAASGYAAEDLSVAPSGQATADLAVEPNVSVSPMPPEPELSTWESPPPSAPELQSAAVTPHPASTVSPWDSVYTSENSSEPSAFELWLTNGNWIVRGGLAILFLGLVFLSKFAYDSNLLPIELRMTAVAAFGIGLLVVGWRARQLRPSYGLSLQGGGIATIYLTVFACVKLADLLPAPLAFILMLSVGVLAAVLAIKQDAMVLAIIGSVGGFLVPILLATGQGSHVGLFSYYALLNVGIMTVALRKAWRYLNSLAVGFTFGVAGLWGMDKYQPEFLLSCLGFLAVFFIQFLVLTLLFTRRQSRAGEAYALDTSVLFGVPTSCFGYAFYMLKPFEYGGAILAVSLSSVYAVLAWSVRRQMHLQRLKAPWAALSLVLATIAVPLIFDARLTSATWALEGAAVVWYSWQQAALRPRIVGYLLVLVGTFGFISHWPSVSNTLPILNAASLGLLSLGLAFLVLGLAGQRFKRNFELLAESSNTYLEARYTSWIGALAVGLAGAVLIVNEIYQRQNAHLASLLVPALLWLWALALHYLSRAWQWPEIAVSAVILPLLTLVLPVVAWIDHSYSPYESATMLNIGLLALLLWQAFALQRMLPDLRSETAAAKLLPTVLTFPGLSVVIFWWIMLARNKNSVSSALLPDASTSMHGWFLPLAAALPMAILWWLAQRQYLSSAPKTSPALWQWLHGQQPLPEQALTQQVSILVKLLVGFVAATTLWHDGHLPGLEYVPFLNLYELVAIASLLALMRVQRFYPNDSLNRWLAGLSFVFGNSILSRILANYYGAYFDWGFAWRSAIAAAAYSIVWSLAALVAMWIASRAQRRKLWLLGAGLLGVVALKLLLIDLAQVGTLARIVSFIGVGVLMLIVGFVAPLPNDSKNSEQHSSSR